MLRASKTPLRVKENESGRPEQKEGASFPPSRDQKSCRVTKPKVIRSSRKENFTDGNQTRPPECALKCPKGPEENLCPPQGSDVSWQLPGSCFGGLSEPLLPLHTKEGFPSHQNYFSTRERDKVEGKVAFGLSEQRGKPSDFAAVRTAEVGMAQESFGRRPSGASPASLKFRRRSTIGLRGSPENNTLIRFLAQQRSSRQEEPFTQVSPFKPANVRPLKDKIGAFQGSFESLQEAEGEPGLSHLGEPSQERDSSQNKTPFKKEPDLEHWSEKFTLGTRGAAWKENLSENETKRSRSELRICSILSPHQAGTIPDPAKEWVCEQQNPIKSLETVVTGDTLEPGHVSRCDHSGSAAVSDLSPRKAELVEDVNLGILDGNQTPVTPLGSGDIPSSDLSQSCSLLRSILKKSPGLELRDSPKEYTNSAIDRGGGGESAAASNFVKAFETLQTEPTDSQSSKTPKKKKVTFGEVLSPEIFDQSLPANTPLRRGASPGCPQGQSPWTRPGLSEEPLPLLDFGLDEEGVEPLPELLEGSVAAGAPSPVENAEVAETDKPDMTTTRSSKRKQGRAVAEGTEQSSTNTEDGKDNKNPRRSKSQRQKNPTTAGPKKTQKTKYPSYGRRKKKKVKKSLYGERETASKKPLLSPIPEIPEVFSSVSSPDSPKADELFTEDAALGNPSPRAACKAPAQPGRICGKGLRAAALGPNPELLEEAAASSGHPEVPGGLEGAPGSAPEFSNALPDAEGDFDPSECFQQGEETPREKKAKESSSLREKENLQGNLLTGLKILEQQDEEKARCPPKPSARGDPARRRGRRRSSSAFYFSPVENLALTGADLPVSFYDVEEVLSVPQAREGSLQGCSSNAELRVRRSSSSNAELKVRRSSSNAELRVRRSSSNAELRVRRSSNAELRVSCSSSSNAELRVSCSSSSNAELRVRRSSSNAELRVRRSMRLSRDAAAEGLAWIEISQQPPLPAAPKGRRSSSSSILAGTENFQLEGQNLLPFPAPGKENESSAPAAPGKENEGSAPLAAAPGRRWRRRSLFEATEAPRAPTQRRRSTNSGCGKDRSNQNHSGAAEILELRLKDVSGIPDFVK